jgi:hypothetical protein
MATSLAADYATDDYTDPRVSGQAPDRDPV